MFELMAEFIEVLLGTLIGIGLIFVSFAILYICTAHIDYRFDKSYEKKQKSKSERRRS